MGALGLPRETEVVIVGGGTAGAVVAARLAQAGVEVLVLEAGPDPGPFGDPRWPADLVDARRLGHSCDWGFDSGDTLPQPMRFERSRVLGGCSTHNGAVQTWGHARDYDGWAAAGNPGWSAAELQPLFARASEQLRVRTYAVEELTPWQRAWHDAGPAAGLPQLRDVNDLHEGVGIAPESVNVVGDGVRFNNAFAYLDPVRALPNLTIVGGALVDRVLIGSGGAARGVAVVHGGALHEVAAPLVVLCGGAYCTPPVLLRSGVGGAAQLRALGIEVALDLPGVGENLHDQPFAMLRWEGSEKLVAAMDAAVAEGWAPDEQVLAKAASRFEPDAFDLHLFAYSPTHIHGGWSWHAGASALRPRSRGHVRLTGRDPEAKPLIDHRFLSDPAGDDVAMLIDGIAQVRELAATGPLAALLGRELTPGPEVAEPATLEAWLRAHPDSYWHPVGTAKMGPASDPSAVCDARGQVHGLPGCRVADAALMPSVPRAATAMPVTVIGERIAASILAERAGGGGRAGRAEAAREGGAGEAHP